MFSMQYIQFFTQNYPNYFDEIYVPLETNGVQMRLSYQILSVRHRKDKCWTRNLILCWSLAFEQLKQDVKSFNKFKYF